MRTQEEITQRIQKVASTDHLGFERASLLEYLDFEHARDYLREGVTKKQWDDVRPYNNVVSIYTRIKSRLPEAWERANQGKRLASTSSMSFFRSWLWLMGEEELAEEMLPLIWLGKCQLLIVSRFTNFGWEEVDDDRWRQFPQDSGISATKAQALLSAYIDTKRHLPFSLSAGMLYLHGGSSSHRVTT